LSALGHAAVGPLAILCQVKVAAVGLDRRIGMDPSQDRHMICLEARLFLKLTKRRSLGILARIHHPGISREAVPAATRYCRTITTSPARVTGITWTQSVQVTTTLGCSSPSRGSNTMSSRMVRT